MINSSSQKRLYKLPLDCIITDIETTGLNPVKDSIIEISSLKIIDGNVIDEFSTLINPNRQIPSFITRLTGINDSMVQNAPNLHTTLNAFLNFACFYPIIGHNIRFDLSFINESLIKCGHTPLNNHYADTLFFSRRLFKELKSHKLSSMAQYLNIDAKGAHRALNDCYMTYHLYKILQEKMSKVS